MSGMLGKYYFSKRSNAIFHQNNLNLSATHLGLNAELLKLIRKKRRLWKQAKPSGDPAKWVKYKRLSNSVKNHLNKAYWNYVNDVLTASLKTNPKTFWSFVKLKRVKA